MRLNIKRYINHIKLIITAGGIAISCCPSGMARSLSRRLPSFKAVQTELFGKIRTTSNAWADFDNDGYLDLALSGDGGEHGGIRLYRNDHGVFVSVGDRMGLPQSGYQVRGLSWGDYDGDGWPDLLGGPISKNRSTYVFHNENGKKFVDVAADIGLMIPGRSARQTNFVDYDNDGDLDVYATDRDGPNKLFRNDNGKFVQVFANDGPTVFRSTVGSCWFDYDQDGHLDLFLANQSGKPDALFHNDGATFVDVAPHLGMDAVGRSDEEGSTACAIGDYDNDGFFDIFVSNYGHNKLYHNNGDGTFTNVAAAVGLDVENHAVGAAWGDYDNDGYLDLAVMSYEGPEGNQVPMNKLYHNERGKRFINVLKPQDPINAGDHGVEWVDYDKDGALDLSVTKDYGPEGGFFLFHNELPKEAARRSLSVLVLDRRGFFTKPGAEVRIYNAQGKILGSRLVPTSGGHNTQSAVPVHFGLRTLAALTVEVTFLTGKGRRVQEVKNIKPTIYAGRNLIIRESN